MFTREDYLGRKCSHRDFYGQYVNEFVLNVVRNCGYLKQILASTDEHLNDVPLSMWDKLANSVSSYVGRRNVEFCGYKNATSSLSDCVCVLKEAARQLKEAEGQTIDEI